MHRPPLRWLAVVLLMVFAGLVPPSGVTTASAAPAAAPVHGLKGEYFRMSAPGARDFAHLGGAVLDPNIDFPGLAGTFGSLTGQTEHTTARWAGKLTAPETGEYTFSLIGDNGFRFFVDNQPVIDHWVPDWDVEQHSRPVRLVAGEAHDVRLELFQDVDGANAFLRWATPTISKRIVPETAFTPPAGFQVYPVDLSVGQDGRKLVADFTEPVTNLGQTLAHLGVEVDTSPMPVSSAVVSAADPSQIVVTLAKPVQRGQRVRFSYDGTGGLAVGGAAGPADHPHRGQHLHPPPAHPVGREARPRAPAAGVPEAAAGPQAVAQPQRPVGVRRGQGGRAAGLRQAAR